MRVLQDLDQVLHIMDAKLDELYERFDKANGEEAAEISGKDVVIIKIAGHIRHAIKRHGYFGVEDMACVYEYVDNDKKEDHEYRDTIDTWFMKGIAKGATWALNEIGKRMEGQP